MSVEIKHVIVHELIKEAKKDFDFSNPYNLRETPLDNQNPVVIKLITEISSLYGSKGNSAHYGVFKEETTEQGPIPSKFDEYTQNTDCTSDLFVPLSIAIMKQLVKKAQEEIWSSGGFIVFCDYTINDNQFFLIAMIKKKNGVTISTKLEPEEMIHLDLSKIHQAARINFDLFEKFKHASESEKIDSSYLSFVSKGVGQSASAYFIAAIGCDKSLAATKATKKLPSEVKKFFTSKPELKEHATKFRHEIVSYLDKQASNDVSARLSDIETIALSHMTYLNNEIRESYVKELMAHLNSEDIRIPTEFVVSKRALKEVKNLTYKGDDIGFSFEKALLGETADYDVWYDEESGRLSFTNLPSEMKVALSQAVRENAKLRESTSTNG
ncbi:nucleoid-associated protein [Klebsiella pneumoniae]|uniref:nucleoid-associated protein n=1 Tax=Klebsiella pneumoniae TaxID=573 RepID=UPI000E2D1499|nr:nucleoid-associated protein [Klebsiella pneumoniae]SVJ69461.1 Nucleoid-associated protein NdpA [Klebsiella pneumoniae]